MSLDFTVGKLLAREREARFVPAAERNAESCGFRVPGSRQGWNYNVVDAAADAVAAFVDARASASLACVSYCCVCS